MSGSKELPVSSAGDFERSNEAHRIFMDVFNGRDVSGLENSSNNVNVNGDFVTRNIVGFGFGPLNYSVCISRDYLDTSTERMKRKRSDGGKLSAPRNESSNGGRASDGNPSQSKCPSRVSKSNTMAYPVHGKSNESTSLTDLYSRLRDNVHYLLKAAGWAVENKKAGKKSSVRTTYKSRTGETFTAFYKTWDLFGKSLLFAGRRYKIVQQEEGKQWINIEQFGSDFSEALTVFEKEDFSQMEPTYALVRRWSLLDPFVTVVMLKKQILTLRKGTPVKVATIVVSDLKDIRSGFRSDFPFATADSVAEGIEAVQDCRLNLALELRPPNMKALKMFTPADAIPESENARKKFKQSGCGGAAASSSNMEPTFGMTGTWLTKKRRTRNF